MHDNYIYVNVATLVQLGILYIVFYLFGTQSSRVYTLYKTGNLPKFYYLTAIMETLTVIVLLGTVYLTSVPVILN